MRNYLFLQIILLCSFSYNSCSTAMITSPKQTTLSHLHVICSGCKSELSLLNFLKHGQCNGKNCPFCLKQIANEEMENHIDLNHLAHDHFNPYALIFACTTCNRHEFTQRKLEQHSCTN